MNSDDQAQKARQRGGELGRMAAKLVKNAGPQTKRFIDASRPKVEKAIQDARPKVEKAIQDTRPKVAKAVEEYRPKVEQAGRNAVQYAQAHEDELRGLALKGARSRFGRFGMAIDALGIGAQPTRSAEPAFACQTCQTANPLSARFCSECGASLNTQPSE